MSRQPASARRSRAPGGARSCTAPLAAIVSDVVEGTRAADLMRRHWQLLEATAATATVVPVQFGTVMAGDAAVAGEFLAPRQDDLEAQLAALDGKVQMTVKGSYDETPCCGRSWPARRPSRSLRERVQGLPEAASLLRADPARRARRRRGRAGPASATRPGCSGELDPIAVATSRETASGLEAAVNAAFLVERERTRRVRPRRRRGSPRS